MSKVCIKVKHLRKIGYTDLEAWIANPDNVYVGRRGRVFIADEKGDKRIFHYKESKFANPFKVPDYTVEESLKLYKEHLEKTEIIKDIGELKGKNLGCFCDQGAPCHAQLLVDLIAKSDQSKIKISLKKHMVGKHSSPM